MQLPSFNTPVIRHFWLYVLRLENGKFYVGISTNFSNRIRQHGGPYGAQWTKLYKPVEVLEVHDLGTITNIEAERIEQDFFEDYRHHYSLKNVRGGRIVSRGPIFRINKFYFNKTMLESLAVASLLLCLSLYILLMDIL